MVQINNAMWSALEAINKFGKVARMKRANHRPLTPQEAMILGILAERKGLVSRAIDVTKAAYPFLPKGSTYTILNSLADRELITKNKTYLQPRYAITAKGEAARKTFANYVRLKI